MMDVMGNAAGGRTGLVRAALLGAVFVGTAVLATAGSDDRRGRVAGRTAPPRTFFAMRRVGAEIVEVDSGTGRVVRTIVDLGEPEPAETSGGLIDGIDLAADERAVWFSRYSREPGVVYRVRLPDGTPERVVDGHGASVSRDGRRLALIRRADLVVVDLTTGQERLFAGLVGELGGAGTVWAGDSHRLAVEILGADVSGVTIVDTQTGETTDLQPVDQPAIEYRVLSPAHRPGDGLLGVVCCHTGEIVDGEPPQSTTLVLHDPASGAEQHRIGLLAPVREIDWDQTGSHLLITDGDRVRHYHDGRFRDIPAIDDVFAVAW